MSCCVWIRRLGTKREVVTPCTTHLLLKFVQVTIPIHPVYFLIIITIPTPKPCGEVGGMYVAGMDLLAAISLSPHVGGASAMTVVLLIEITVVLRPA